VSISPLPPMLPEIAL